MADDYKILTKAPQPLCVQLMQQSQFQAKAMLYAKGLKLKGLKSGTIGKDYLFLPVNNKGICIAFHFGVLVFINLEDNDVTRICNKLEDYADQLYDTRLTEEISVSIKQSFVEGVVSDNIQLKTCTSEHLEIIADALSKSIKLDHFEKKVSAAFAKVEPIALNLRNKGRLDHSSSQLLRHIGESLLTEFDIVGRIEVLEKPNVLWEHAELEPLYKQLIEEFEIMERQVILDKKLELLARTAQTSLEVLQHRHASRLEWYIIILIMVSICIEFYALVFAGH